ncbi:MAG: 5'-nucleotidase C-terminal domain-containing protein [Myxococcales bacterium]
MPALTRLSTLLAAAALVASCAAASRPASGPQAPSEPIKLTIVSTNDLHGWVQAKETRLSDGRVVRTGGAEILAGYVARLREENPGGVLLFDAGDMFQGTLVANLSEGEAVVAAYNVLGYDAAAIGNHEFDYGPNGPKSAAVDPGDDPLGALESRARQAHFPFLARNVYLANGQRPAFFRNDGLAMVERKGLKIGIVGLLTPLTPQVTNPVNVSGLRFGPLAAEGQAAAAELRKRGADILIALVHAGGRCASFADPNDLASCDPKGEIFEMLQQMPRGLFDAVLSAHTHTRLQHVINGTPVVQANSYGTHFSLLELVVDPDTRRVRTESTKLVGAVAVCEKTYPGSEACDPKKPAAGDLVPATFHGKALVPDPAVTAALSPYIERVAQEHRRALRVAVPEPLTRNYKGESLLGNALADTVNAMEKTDVTLLNAGGLRADLASGELTFGALYEVFPFDNSVSTVTLTGEQILKCFEVLASSGHGAPQIAGVRVKGRKCGETVSIVEARFTDGRPFDRTATYRLTTSDFLALGGDGLGKVFDTLPATQKDFGHRRQLNMRDALAAFLEKRGGTLTAQLDGRLTIETTGCPTPP